MKKSLTRGQGLESPNEWGAYASSLIDVEEIGEREVLEIWEFARKYLPHYLVDQDTREPVDFAEFHHEIFAIVQSRKTKKREAWAAPRGHAKSTIMCTIVVLWWICNKLKRFILIVSDTSSQAEAQLQTVITEIEENEALQEDFHLGPAFDRRGNVVAWRDDEISISNGVTVAAKGAGKSIRGLKKKAYRPDAIIIDDLENEESVRTKFQRDKLESWLLKTLLPLSSKNADVYYIGTILHYDSVLARVMRKADVWNVKLWRAVGKDLETGKFLWDEEHVLWRAYWPLEALLDKKKEIGSISFACEYLNEPMEAGDHPIKQEWFCYYDPDRLPRERLLLIQTVDPAISKKDSADYSAICTLGWSEGCFYLVDMWRDHVSFNELIKTGKAKFAKYHPMAQGIEAVAFQQAVVQEMVRTSGLPAYPIYRQADKVTRAVGVSVHFENGRVLFPRGAPWLDELELELVQFPAGENDDMLDALIDAIEAFQPGEVAEQVVTHEDMVEISNY